MKTIPVPFHALPVGTAFTFGPAFHKKTGQTRAVNHHAGHFYTPAPDSIAWVEVNEANHMGIPTNHQENQA